MRHPLNLICSLLLKIISDYLKDQNSLNFLGLQRTNRNTIERDEKTDNDITCIAYQ